MTNLIQTNPNIQITTNCNTPTAKGVSFISLSNRRCSWDPDTDVFYRDDDGRALGIALTLDSDTAPKRKLKVMGVYCPNTAQKQVSFFESIPPHTLKGLKLLAGDFNMVEHTYDRNPPHADAPQTVRRLGSLVMSRGLKDAWLQNHDKGTGHTFQSSNQTLSTSRIDRVYAKESILQKSIKWEIVDFPPPYDHKGICFEYFHRHKIDKGPGTWQM
ncbi:hypothetical protein DFH27DRAFT_489263, partial [Peziza echinospora]